MVDEEALLAIYHETIRPLYAYVSRRTGGDRGLSEDVTQEAWLRALDHWARRGPPDRPLAWLETVARRLLANHYRRRVPSPVDPAEIMIESPDWRPVSPSVAGHVHRALARIKTRQARLLEAFYFDGKPTRALAADLHVTERAVEGRLRRARSSLARQLKTPC